MGSLALASKCKNRSPNDENVETGSSLFASTCWNGSPDYENIEIGSLVTWLYALLGSPKSEFLKSGSFLTGVFCKKWSLNFESIEKGSFSTLLSSTSRRSKWINRKLDSFLIYCLFLPFSFSYTLFTRNNTHVCPFFRFSHFSDTIPMTDGRNLCPFFQLFIFRTHFASRMAQIRVPFLLFPFFGHTFRSKRPISVSFFYNSRFSDTLIALKTGHPLVFRQEAPKHSKRWWTQRYTSNTHLLCRFLQHDDW